MTVADMPHLFIVGPPRHGVVRYARDLGRAVRHVGLASSLFEVDTPEKALSSARRHDHVHVHVTDRLFGATPLDAANHIEHLAKQFRLTMTLHDLPQASDGSGLNQRIDAYSRFIGAADGVVVNSQHEADLIQEYLAIPAHTVAVIPLGVSHNTHRHTRVADEVGADADANGHRPIVALITGFIYPGKGHLQAIHAVSTATENLRSAGINMPKGIIIAIGAAADGHESDIEQLQAEAKRVDVELMVTGYLNDEAYRSDVLRPGIPLAAHQHVSASRSMIDWIEMGRRPLIPDSRYAREMNRLRPNTARLYAAPDLPEQLEHAWRHPAATELAPGTDVSPTILDAAQAYRSWWSAPSLR